MIEPKTHRSFLSSLLWTTEGHLDLTWALCLGIFLVAAGCALCECLTGVSISNATWAFLGGAFFSALVAAIPIAKARLLASSKAGEAIAAIGGAATQAPAPHGGLLAEVGDVVREFLPPALIPKAPPLEEQ